jgi:hypothetical protein
MACAMSWDGAVAAAADAVANFLAGVFSGTANFGGAVVGAIDAVDAAIGGAAGSAMDGEIIGAVDGAIGAVSGFGAGKFSVAVAGIETSAGGAGATALGFLSSIAVWRMRVHSAAKASSTL